MALKILFVIGALMLSTASAYADGFYKLVGYTCDAKANAVIITYAAALGEAGKKMTKNKNPRQWDPWSLIETTKDKNSIRLTRPVHGQCKLEDGIYSIKLGPLPGNANLQGMCGGHMAAWAEVRRGSDVVLPRHDLESGDCHYSGLPVTVKIVIEAGGKKPVIQTVPWKVFYK